MSGKAVSTRTKRTAFGRWAGRLFFRGIVSSLLRTTQTARRTQFDALGPAQARVVMLGDSITEFGIWDEWLPDAPIVNRGIGGEISSQVLARLGSAIDQPLAVFLLVGTNDLAFGVAPLEIAHNVASILREIERAAPGTPVIVQSVMPRALVFRDEIVTLNLLFKNLVANAPDHVRYLDLWPALATTEGALRPELTEDELHLNGNGYREWVEVLRPLMTEFGSRKPRASRAG